MFPPPIIPKGFRIPASRKIECPKSGVHEGNKKKPPQETLILKFEPKRKSTEGRRGKSILICPLFTFPEMAKNDRSQICLAKKRESQK
jgi:hypothetical protein